MQPAWQATDEELLGALAEAQRRVNEAAAAMVPLVAEIATRGLAGATGHRDTADLLRTAQNVTRSTARARVRAAEKLTPMHLITGQEVDPEQPLLAAAFAAAEISAEHVRVVQAVLASVPPHLDEHRGPLEADLVAHARTLDPDAVAGLGRRALALLDPDGPRPREPRPTRNRLTLRPQGAGVEARGWFDAESAAVLRTALSPLTAPVPPVEGAEDATRDERSTAERTGDGVVELARRMLATDALGTENGQAVQVVVTVPVDDLTGAAGAARIGFGDGRHAGALPVAAARRLACDAGVLPVVLSGAGEPLDRGRDQRLASRAQRRALAQRDGGCAFPGCDVPPPWCIAHHIVHWADGGATDLANLTLLCPHHHVVVHHGEWRIESEAGFPVFHPPPWVPGGPRRNPLHRPDILGRIPLQVRVPELC